MDIRLEHKYNEDRRIMKHVYDMNEEEVNELKRLIENKRIWKIETNEKIITWLKENKEKYFENEIAKYQYTVKNNNNHFCACGIRCKNGMGKTKFRCGKEVCKLYENKIL